MSFFFFNDTATTEIYTLSLHDALPIYPDARKYYWNLMDQALFKIGVDAWWLDTTEPETEDRETNILDQQNVSRSEEHTSELQSQSNLVCRLLLEKKKTSKRHTVRQRTR